MILDNALEFLYLNDLLIVSLSTVIQILLNYRLPAVLNGLYASVSAKRLYCGGVKWATA